MPISDSDSIKPSSELLLRQVHPNFMQAGRLWSRAFTPTDADNGELSVDRDTIISAKDAFERYLANKKLSTSGGCWGVSVQEFSNLGLNTYSDPITDTENPTNTNLAHALVNFAAYPTDKHKALGKAAHRKAADRGQLYP